MNTLAIKIRTTKAPTQEQFAVSRVSKYRELFNKMKKGHWFVIDAEDYAKLSNAGFIYAKGRYSLYKHPTQQGRYVFRLNK